MRRTWLIGVLVACGGSSEGPGDGPSADVIDSGTGLDKTSTVYRETCDGSGALALSFTHFVDVNDENQVARIYERAKSTAPVQMIELNPGLGLTGTVEADLEDLEQIGNRVFVTASHGRKTSGALDRARYKFAAFDVAGTAPNVTLTSAGVSGQLLDQMLVAGNWDQPNQTVITALTTSSKLADNNQADLAPEIDGTNIEALANDGTGKLLIGFRNPRPGNKAIVVALANPDAALTGTARFAGAAELDLGGLGIRGMAYSPAHAAVLIIAGPHDGANAPFKLYKWSGALTAAPTLVTTITAPGTSAPEAIVPYPGTKDVQIVFDGGDAQIGGVGCKDAPVASRVFSDAILTVD